MAEPSVCGLCGLDRAAHADTAIDHAFVDAVPSESNAARLAELVYVLLSGCKGSGSSFNIEHVRRPNSNLRDHIDVCFANGENVIVWFEKNGRGS